MGERLEQEGKPVGEDRGIRKKRGICVTYKKSFIYKLIKNLI